MKATAEELPSAGFGDADEPRFGLGGVFKPIHSSACSFVAKLLCRALL